MLELNIIFTQQIYRISSYRKQSCDGKDHFHPLFAVIQFPFKFFTFNCYDIYLYMSYILDF